MLKRIVKYIKKCNLERRVHLKRLSDLDVLYSELTEIQNYLDHEGKMRGYYDDDNIDKGIIALSKKREAKQAEIAQFIKDNNL